MLMEECVAGIFLYEREMKKIHLEKISVCKSRALDYVDSL